MSKNPTRPRITAEDVHIKWDHTAGRIKAYVHNPDAYVVSASYPADGSVTLDRILAAFQPPETDDEQS